MSYDPNAANIAMLKGYVQSARPMEEMFSVRGKTAIITGATSGLGFNIALRLLQGGANVVIAGSSRRRGTTPCPSWPRRDSALTGWYSAAPTCARRRI